MVYDFGYRLRELRKERKLTQDQVARRLNLSKTTISGYENNVKTPSLDVLVQLSVFYNVTADYLLGLENRKMLYIDGLTDRQQEILSLLLTEFPRKKSALKAFRPTRLWPAPVLFSTEFSLENGETVPVFDIFSENS